jgi:hypothetical protein
MSDTWKRLAELPIDIESYELTGHDREYGDFTRPSTVVHMHGRGQEGIGEDVVYDVLDHIAHRDAGPKYQGELTGPTTLGDACELLGDLDLFDGHPPVMEASLHYRRWAYESAALDLALRQNGLALWEVVERDPQPLRFVCSTRLGSFDGGKSTTEPLRKRLARYPGLEFKLDPENDWDQALIDEIAEIATVRVLDLKGFYKGTPVDVDTDPELYAAVAEKFPEAYIEDPDLNSETEPVLEPYAERVTFDAPLHSLDDVKKMARKTINSKPSRFGSLQELLAIYEYCEQNGIGVYSGGQGEVECGRGQNQYLSSLFHASMPNDIAPSGYNDPAVPAGMPTSPMDPAQSDVGFRWGE